MYLYKCPQHSGCFLLHSAQSSLEKRSWWTNRKRHNKWKKRPLVYVKLLRLDDTIQLSLLCSLIPTSLTFTQPTSCYSVTQTNVQMWRHVRKKPRTKLSSSLSQTLYLLATSSFSHLWLLKSCRRGSSHMAEDLWGPQQPPCRGLHIDICLQRSQHNSGYLICKCKYGQRFARLICFSQGDGSDQ